MSKGVTTRRSPIRIAGWLAAIAMALSLLLPWEASSAANAGFSDFAPEHGPQHRSECPLFAERVQAAPAQPQKSSPVPLENPSDSPFASAGDRGLAALGVRPTALAAPTPPQPIYLLSRRLRR